MIKNHSPQRSGWGKGGKICKIKSNLRKQNNCSKMKETDLRDIIKIYYIIFIIKYHTVLF